MRQLRPALARFLMVWLVAGFVMGAIGMGASGAGMAMEPAHMAGHVADAAMEPGRACPEAAKTGATMQKGHGACAMTVCCFSEGSQLGVETPDFVLVHVLSAEPRLTQAEPERAKKPPRLT